MAAILVEKLGSIDIGRQGENLARIIQIDVTSLLTKWPDATITLLVKRKSDAQPYFANTSVKDGILNWPITSVETAVAGGGKIEIQAISGSVIEKSVTGSFSVSSSLSGSASTEPPAVRPSWVDELLAAGGGSISDPGIAHQQLVSDAKGKAIWEERLAYKAVESGEFEVLPETELLGEDDDGNGANDTFFVATAWTTDPVVGGICKVNYNGNVYECEAKPFEQEDIPEGCVVLGNTALMQLSEESSDVPFCFLCIPNGIAESLSSPYCAIGRVSDGASSVSLSITQVATITRVKTIDDEFLPDNVKRTPITLTVSSDGSITSSMSFMNAWRFSAAQLQSMITIRETSIYKGDCYATVDAVSKCTGALGGYMQDFISIRFRKPWIDSSDSSDLDKTRVLQWTASAIAVTDTFGVLPHDSNGAMAAGSYLRYLGNNNWQIATIDQLKADLGLT